MRYVITGATARTSSIVAERLLEQGKELNVVGRNVERLKTLSDRGARPFQADPSDGKALALAFEGADAAWIMLQPNYIPDSPDFRAFQTGLINALVYAISKSNIKYVVTLSSWGADVASGNGPVAGLHDMEQAFNQLPDVNVLHLRAGYFMENMLGYIPSIIQSDIVAGPFNPNIKLSFIATKDIGNYAAMALINPDFKGKVIQELHGQRDMTIGEAVSIIGNAIGKPGLEYEEISNYEFTRALLDTGVSESVAGLMGEVVTGINSRHIKMSEPRSVTNSTLTSFEEFVNDTFLPVYRESLAG
jgi:uncharacterized protein YbjT (DUF2867 family)